MIKIKFDILSFERAELQIIFKSDQKNVRFF